MQKNTKLSFYVLISQQSTNIRVSCDSNKTTDELYKKPCILKVGSDAVEVNLLFTRTERPWILIDSNGLFRQKNLYNSL